MLPNQVNSPAPSPAPEGGEVLAAGRARGPDANPASNPKPLSVKAFSMPSRVCCAGLRPPLTAPKMQLPLRPATRPCIRRGKARLVNFHSKRHWARKSRIFSVPPCCPPFISETFGQAIGEVSEVTVARNRYGFIAKKILSFKNKPNQLQKVTATDETPIELSPHFIPLYQTTSPVLANFLYKFGPNQLRTINQPIVVFDAQIESFGVAIPIFAFG